MILVYTHSGLRYLVLLFGLLCVGYAIYGTVTRREYDPKMRVFGGLFAMAMHTTILSGIALLFTRPFASYLINHIFMMIFAAVVAQIVPSVMRRRPMEERTYLPHAVSAAVALALVVGGILSIGRPLVGSAYS